MRGDARASLAPSIRPSCMPRPNLTDPLASMALSTAVGGQRSREHVFMSGAPGRGRGAMESVASSTGPHGRTTACHNGVALGGWVARPECAVEPRAWRATGSQGKQGRRAVAVAGERGTLATRACLV